MEVIFLNIYDIAAKSGVSIATVSRVLNNSPDVRAQTRERVLRVMQEEGFVPNSFARGLSRGSMSMVGILCTNIRDAFYTNAVGYIEQHLREKNMHTVLRCTGTDMESKKQALEYMVQQNVDAVFLIGSAFQGDADNAHIAAAAQQIPVIILNGYVELPGVYCVTSDERGAIRDLVQLLNRLHRSQILFLHDSLTYSGRQKIAGYEEGHRLCGLPVDASRVVQVERQLDKINACIKRLLVQRVTFDAVIGSEDILALGAQKALQRIGLSMPIIGCNNSQLACCCTPELTSIDNALEEMCATALHMLDELLQKRPAPAHVEIPAHLVERESFRFS